MARVPPRTDDAAGPQARSALDSVAAAHGRVTNMKQTLARSPAALRALMTWYDLREEVRPFLGDRLTDLFAHAISAETDCLVFSTFFRRLLFDAGEDPDDLRLDVREHAVIDYGRQLATDPNDVSDELFARVANHFTHEQVVALTAFGTLMVATNLVNNTLRVDLDECLIPYRKESAV